MGFIATTVVGITGSLIGGVPGGIFKKPESGAKFHPAGFAMSIVGTIRVIIIVSASLLHLDRRPSA